MFEIDISFRVIFLLTKKNVFIKIAWQFHNLLKCIEIIVIKFKTNVIKIQRDVHNCNRQKFTITNMTTNQHNDNMKENY